jgi:phosphoribosylamine--glycine ligase
MERIVLPTLAGMAAEGTPYRGVLYFGLMLTREGIKVLEYNARMGDPETQPILMRLESDILDVCDALLERRLDRLRLRWDAQRSVCIVLASGGYPGEYEKGIEISGLDGIEKPAVKVFHAGTELRNGSLVTAGGRVLGVTAKAGTLQGALDLAYSTVERIQFRNMHFRRDIGRRGLAKEHSMAGHRS